MGIELIVADLQFQPLRALARAGIQPLRGSLRFTPTLQAALEELEESSGGVAQV